MAWNGSDGVKVPKVEEKNEIVVYQPNGTLRLEVLVGNETVWLTQAQLCELFGVVKSNVSYHFKNIYSSGELSREATVQEIRTVRNRPLYGGLGRSRYRTRIPPQLVGGCNFSVNNAIMLGK